MKVDIFSLEGNKIGSLELPEQFNEEYEPNLVRRAILVIENNNRQPYGAMPKAGQGVSAKLSRRRRNYKGSYGKGISRVPRKTMWKRGMQFGWEGALAPGTKGGRRAHPPKAEKIWTQKINKKERRKAIRSALSGIALQNKLKIVENKIEEISKTKELKKVFEKIGINAAKVERRRPGKGKTRGREKRYKKNALIVVSKKCNLMKSANSIPGFDIIEVNKLNAAILTLGHELPRECLWTKEAMEILSKEKLFLGDKK
ncbi:MAG TPA: 50S ribosomal protein L4 [Candidatus Nanoarchaeia archaeon]|nr:50S ribosomal protein L4 [Candidatus Nanoarchaeia archaeon]